MSMAVNRFASGLWSVGRVLVEELNLTSDLNESIGDMMKEQILINGKEYLNNTYE